MLIVMTFTNQSVALSGKFMKSPPTGTLKGKRLAMVTYVGGISKHQNT